MLIVIYSQENFSVKVTISNGQFSCDSFDLTVNDIIHIIIHVITVLSICEKYMRFSYRQKS